MVKKKKDPLWREFEKLATRIEATLSPLGAKVSTPDKILDSVTGEMREVDASIRYNLDKTETLITLECRRRKDKENVTWIEQLITKKQDINAEATIAITPRGVSKSAKTKAEKQNIKIKTLEEITEEEIKSWLRLTYVELTECLYKIVNGTVGLEGLEDNEVIFYDPSILKNCHENKLLYPIFEDKKYNIRYSYEKPLKLARDEGYKLFEGVSEGNKVEKIVKYPLNSKATIDRNIVVRTNKGFRNVSYIELKVEVSINKKREPINSIFRYGELGNKIEGVEFNLNSVIPETTLMLQKNMTTGKYSLELVKKK